MDIRDYLPPSLKHVMAYTSAKERERRRQEAQDAFGHPTPVPIGPEALDDTDEPTLKKLPASPWAGARRAPRGVEKGTLPSARGPHVEGGPKAKAPVRVVPLRVVVIAALLGLLAGGIVIARAVLVTKQAPAAAQVSPRATAPVSPAATGSAVPMENPIVMGTAPAATTEAIAGTAVPTVAETAPSVKAAPRGTASPREQATPDAADPYEDAAPAVKSTKQPSYVERLPEF